MYESVFRPLKIADVTVPNRIVRAAHTVKQPWLDKSDALIEYHAARAEGGVGLSIMGASGVHRKTPMSVPLYDDAVIPHYQRLMKRIAPTGMKVFQQLWHGGAVNPSRRETVWSASDVTMPTYGGRPIPMTQSMIDEVIEAFASAARRVKAGGLDGVELHAAHGYLIPQFLSPATNRREDKYGGSLENRTRFLSEVIAAIRSEVGEGYPIAVRLSAREWVEGGLSPEDTLEIAKLIEPCIDLLDISTGSHFRPDQYVGSMDFPLGYEIQDGAQITQDTQIPTLLTGRIMTLDDAETVLSSGVSDLVSMVRATIADPTLVQKSRTGLADRVRPCIGTNQGCYGEPAAGRRFACIVNPSASREDRIPFETPLNAARVKRVVVVGGGLAGLEAARAAAQRGHTVDLFEQARKLGGQVALAAKAPHRADVGGIVSWLEAEVRRLGVNVRLGAAPDPDDIEALQPDDVIIATGSVPLIDGRQASEPVRLIENLASTRVYSSWDVLNGSIPPGSKAFVFDDTGLYDSISVVEQLVESGFHVTLATRLGSMGASVPAPEVTMAPALRRIANAEVAHIAMAKLLEVTPTDVAVQLGDRVHRVEADTVVFVGYNELNRDYADYFEDARFGVHVIGDAAGTHTIAEAVSQAWGVARAT